MTLRFVNRPWTQILMRLILLCGVLRGPVLAQPVIVEAERIKKSKPGDTGSTTRIDVENAPAGANSLTELLEREASVRVRRYGGEGYQSNLSIRGSNPGQVSVSLDGIPLSNAVRGEVNLEDHSLDGLESVEVFRSGDLPGSAIGGAVNLVTRKGAAGQGYQIKARGGSFKAAELGGAAVGGRALRYNAHVRGATSDQDFKFRSDNGTPVLNEWDDFDDLRKNSHYHNYFGTVHLSHSGPRHSYFLLNDATWRSHGVPGPVPGQSEKVERIIGRNTTGLGADWKGLGADWFRLQSKLYYTHLGEHLRDPEQEFSFNQPNARSRLQQYGFQLTPEFFLPYQELRLHAHGNYEIFNEEKLDRFDKFVEKVPRKFREQYTFRLEDEFIFFQERLRLLPAVEYQRTTDRFREENREEDLRVASGRIQNFAELEKSRQLRRFSGQKVRRSEETIFAPSSTITEFINKRFTFKGMVYKAKELDFWLHGGAYTGSRLPLFIELFGEQGSIIGNPDLEAEKAETVEAGLGAAFRLDWLRGSIEATAFKRIIDDMILFVPNSQFTLRPENVDRAIIRGAEFGARLEILSSLKVFTSYTYQRALNDSEVTYLKGKYLPLRPMHESSSGISYYNEYLETGIAIVYVGAVFRDRTNEYPGYQEPRWIYNGYFNWHIIAPRDNQGTPRTAPQEKLTLSLEVKNIQNLRVEDTVGYPLPGRSAYASLTYKFHTLEKNND